MNDHVDPHTGEVATPYSNGAAAIGANAAAALARKREELGVENRFLADAIMKAMETIPIWIKAEKDSGRGNAKYATLKDIMSVVRPALLAQGVRIRQGADRSWSMDEGGGSKGRLVPVYTDLVHPFSGQVERTIVEIPITRLDPQAMGSAITYGRRYSLLAALGLATDEADDDASRAMPRDLNTPVVDSNEFRALKAEIDAFKTLDALDKWAKDQKNRKRLDNLSDGEAERVREIYSSKRSALSEAA